MNILVLRIGHRPTRDARITTHVCLVARAFGANGVLIDTKDPKLEEKIKDVIERWGNSFKVISGVNPKKVVKKWRGLIVHLTMYGLHIDNVLPLIKRDTRKMLIIVGSQKVPRFYYENSDYNVAVGHQPHSEVSALAIFLDRLFEGKELKKDFKGIFKVLPTAHGKRVLQLNSNAKK